MLLHTADEVYKYYENALLKHLRWCNKCDMDNSCSIFDSFIAERKLKLLILSIQGYVIIK